MTKVIAPNVVLSEATAPAKCTICGEKKELRPYGKDGNWVCFGCMKENEEEGKRQFNKLFDGTRDI